MKNRKILLLGLCLLLACAQVAVAANLKGVYDMGKKGMRIGEPGIQFRANSSDPTSSEVGAKFTNGRLYYNTSTGLRLYHGTSWVTLGATTADADTVYDTGSDWTVTADTHDCVFNYTAGYNHLLNATVTASACVLETDNATGTAAASILCSATSTVTTAIDASAAGIVNAIHVGDNVIKGDAGSIALTDFTVSTDGNVVILSDGSSPCIDLTPSTTTAIGIDLTDTNLTLALSVGAQAIQGTTGTLTWTNFAVDGSGHITNVSNITSDGNLICVDIDPTGDVDIGDALDVTGATTLDSTLYVAGASTLVGNVDVTGDFDVTGTSTFSTGIWTTDNVVAKTTNGSLGLNGQGNGGVVLQASGLGAITLTTDTTVTTDFVVNGGDFTMTSGVASKPNLLFTNSVVGITGSVTTYDHTRGGVATVAGDDIHIDYYNGLDSGPVADTFVTVLYECTDPTAGAEDGNVTWSIVSAGSDLNFLELDGVGGVEINAAAADVDLHVDGDEGADLILVDASENHVIVTRALAAGATTSAAVFTVSQTSATADDGTAVFSNAAGNMATAASIYMNSTASAFDYPTLVVNHDGTAGTTANGAVVIDSEDVNNAALYVRSPVTQAGLSAVYDETVVAIVAEGVGGALSLYRNVTSATNSVLLVEDNHADSTGPLATFTYDGDDTADDVAVSFNATDVAYDEAVVAIVNAGLGRGLFIDQGIATGATLEPALEVDSENVDNAGVVIRSACDGTGSNGDFDQYAVGISAEGVGGGLHVHRDVSNPTHPLVMIEEDNAMAASSHYLLHVQSDADDSASLPTVYINTTDANNDQVLLVAHQLGAAANIYCSGLTPLIEIGDSGDEDAQINFIGRTGTYHFGIDDTNDALQIGSGATLGTTTALTVDANQVVTVAVALNVPYEVLTTTKTVTAYEGGKCFALNAAGAFVTTLPAVASSAGMHLRFAIRTQPTTSHTIVTVGGAGENTMSGGINELEVDTNEDGSYHAAGDTITFVANTAVAGDYVDMWCDGVFWYVRGQCNADGGVTITQASP